MGVVLKLINYNLVSVLFNENSTTSYTSNYFLYSNNSFWSIFGP